MDRISLSLGSGGKLMGEFLRDLVARHLGNPLLERFGDSARLQIGGGGVAGGGRVGGRVGIGFTTDSFVIQPIFFPGGDIGKLAVAGTVNDLVVSGARPRFLSLALIIEEGFAVADLERVLASVGRTAEQADVRIVTGDTKVVRKGEADGLYINTAGVGEIVGEPAALAAGDAIIVSGSVGDHAVAVMVARREFDFEGDVESDCRPLHELLPVWNMGAKWMRDVTRGGLATILCECAEAERVSILVEEARVPLAPAVGAVAEILGVDPLYLASEGKAVMVAPRERASDIVAFLRGLPGCAEAAVIGRIGGEGGRQGEAALKSISGGMRLLEPLTGELLPRIC